MSIHHAAALVSCLPPGSMTLAKFNPKIGWTISELLLLAIANSFRDKETVIDPFNEFSNSKKMECVEMSIDELEAFLSRPRKDVTKSVE